MKKSLFVLMLASLLLASCGSKKVATPAKKIERISHAVPVSSDQTRRLISEARRWIGTPYRYGGQTLAGTDCSGFVMMVFDSVYGLKLPRSSAQQRQYSLPIAEKELAPGDLVFFCTSGGSAVNHVGIYIGSGKMIHASLSKGVMESSLDEKYYSQRFHSAGRVVTPTSDSPSEIAADRRELKNKIKQLEKEKKQLSKGAPEAKPEAKPEQSRQIKTNQQLIIQQQTTQPDTTYVVTDPSIFD